MIQTKLGQEDDRERRLEKIFTDLKARGRFKEHKDYLSWKKKIYGEDPDEEKKRQRKLREDKFRDRIRRPGF